ncbi:MAG: BCD family MFS transporter [Anaerolineaceae bacterium]|nr:BCD family MFS transporter [Anaerolineaceae bacterium]
MVPINSTLNRIMIKEMAISATLVAILASLPYLFSPLQVVIGSYSDRHPWFGFRRTPYIALGLGLCVIGVALAPQVVFLLPHNPFLGLLLSLLVFGAWGMGFNVASVSYLSLASEISGEKGRSRTVSIMWFVMIVGIIITAAALGRLLEGYTHETLQRAFGYVAFASLLLGGLGLIRLEPRHVFGGEQDAAPARKGWQALIRGVLANRSARHFFFYLIILLAAILGQDVLLEPFGGEAFGLSVAATTRITSIWGTCVLLTLLAAGWMERRMDKRSVARLGAWFAIAGFVMIALSGLLRQAGVFYLGVVLLGLGTGLATVSNLSLMLDMTTAQVGLYIGAWGMAEALARLLGTVLSGVIRDLVANLSHNSILGYITVFLIEAVLLGFSLFMLSRVDVEKFRHQSQTVDERAALLNEASG